MRIDLYIHDAGNEEELSLLKQIKALLVLILAALQPPSNAPTGGTITFSNIREKA